MNTIKLQVKGYQNIKSTSIDLEGITMVVGTTNNGKSALRRAMEASLFTEAGEQFINRDMSASEVSWTFPEEECFEAASMSWAKKRGKSAEYKINEVDYTKTGRKGPTDELAALGFKDVSFKDSSERLHVWRQLEPPFLVSSSTSPSQVFGYLSFLMEHRKLLPVLKQVKDDNTQLEADALRYEGAVEAHKANIIAVEAKIENYKVLEESKDLLAKSRILRDTIRSLRSLLKDIKDAEYLVQQCFIDYSALRELEGILPKIQATDALINPINALRSWGDHFVQNTKVMARLEDMISSLSPVQKAKNSLDTFDVDSFRSLIYQLDDLKTHKLRLQTLKQTLDSFESASEEAQRKFKEYEQEIGTCPTCDRPFGSHSH